VEADITGDPEYGSKIKLEGKCQAGPVSGGGGIAFVGAASSRRPRSAPGRSA